MLLFLSTAAAWAASRVRFENSIEVWFPEGDPAVATYDEFSREFQSDELIVLRGELGVYEFAWSDGIGQTLEQGILLTDLLLTNYVGVVGDVVAPEPPLTAGNGITATAEITATTAITASAWHGLPHLGMSCPYSIHAWPAAGSGK